MKKDKSNTDTGRLFERFVEIVRKLRAPDGCPWDREQTHESLRPYLVEEVFELVDSIDAADLHGIREELGDILLHVLFHADIRAERGDFDIDDVMSHVIDKLIRRHPHVFADVNVSGSDEVLHNWENIKLTERQERNDNASLLDGIPHSMPALLIAQRMQEKAARIGFDWKNVRDVWDKIKEEIAELDELIAPLTLALSQRERVQDLLPSGEGVSRQSRETDEGILAEIGDILFAIVNLARQLDMNAEMALRHANSKFARRFRYIEKRLREEGIENPTLEIMDKFWDEAKEKELTVDN